MTAFLAFSIAIGAPSFTASSPSLRPEPAWGKPAGGLRLSLRSSQKTYVAGERFLIDMVLQNVGNKDWEVLSCGAIYLYSFEAWGQDGSQLPLTEGARGLIARGLEGSRSKAYLRPKNEDISQIGIYGVFDMKKPGAYRIIATREVKNLLDPKQSTKVTSNPLTITIAPPKEKKDK